MKHSSTFRRLSAGAVFPRSCQPQPQLLRATDALSSDAEGLATAQQVIDVDGEDIPDPVDSFAALAARYDVPGSVVQQLNAMGYETPTVIQQHALPLMLERREMMCSAPTGSGKTLAFLLPIVSVLRSPQTTGFRALVLTPTRELAKQVHAEFIAVARGTGLRIHVIKSVREAGVRFGNKSKGFKDVLVTTPNRLLYLLNQDPPVLNLTRLLWLVIDECDKLFEEDFREQLAFIYHACSRSQHLRRAMFSATFSDELAQWFKVNLDNVVSLIVGGKNCATGTVAQRLQFVGSEEGKVLALKNLILEGLDVPVLIFVSRSETASRLFQQLIRSGVNAECIHSGRPQAERERVVRQFRQGSVLFLVATELLGRGIDFRAVNTVINYDCPTSSVAYIHRIGRTGRAGRRGQAITFYGEEDVPRLRCVLQVMTKAGCQLPAFLQERPRAALLCRTKRLGQKAKGTRETADSLLPHQRPEKARRTWQRLISVDDLAQRPDADVYRVPLPSASLQK